MLTLQQVQADARRAGRRASRNHVKPLRVAAFDKDDPREFIRRIPYLGTHCPQGWTRAKDGQGTPWDDLFVDSTGWSWTDAGGPALSLAEFCRRLEDLRRSGDPYGVGLSEVGEFQVYVRVYRTDPRDFTRTGALTEAELRSVAVGGAGS